MDPIVKIQALVRGFLQRRANRRPRDGMTKELMRRLVDGYKNQVALNEEVNLALNNWEPSANRKVRKVRNPVFPSEISENVAKLALCRKFGLMGSWNTVSGDMTFMDRKVEVKGFSSTGPNSFGPKESWDWLCFVDACDFKKDNYKVYLLKISNVDEAWQRVAVNRGQTYRAQCAQGKRPRVKFNSIQNQLREHCLTIFDGNLEALLEVL